MSIITPIKAFVLVLFFSSMVWAAGAQNVLYSDTNFWAKVDVSNNANETFYGFHRSSEGYFLYTYSSQEWSSLTSLTASTIGLHSIGENVDMEVSPSGTVHLVFDGCTSALASSCNLYYISYSGSWSAKTALSVTAGFPKNPQLKIDKNGNLHVSYIERDATNIEHLFYSTNASGVWSSPRDIVYSSTLEDEIHKQWLTLSSDNTVSLYYVKEDNQNLYQGNLYVTSSTDGFINQSIIVDALATEMDYQFNDVYQDALDRVHLNYTVSNSERTASYMYHAQSNDTGFTETKVGSDTNFEQGQYYYINNTLSMLVLKSDLDFGSKNIYLATKEDGSSWVEGNDLGIVDVSANEIAFGISPSNNLVILFEDAGIDTVMAYKDNTPPVADAGFDQSGVVGDVVDLNGTGSYDGDGNLLTYSWSVAIPGSSTLSLSGATPSFTPDIVGTYEATLIVHDGYDYSTPSSAIITVVSIPDAAKDTVEETIDAITSITSFSNPNRGNALTNKLNSILDLINAGEYQVALDKLNNDILPKTDGCTLDPIGVSDKKDWIEDCDEQKVVYDYVNELIDRLNSLINS